MKESYKHESIFGKNLCSKEKYLLTILNKRNIVLLHKEERFTFENKNQVFKNFDLAYRHIILFLQLISFKLNIDHNEK